MLISLKYKRIGVCQRYLLEYFGISSSTFYITRQTFFSNGWIKKKDKKRCKGYSMKTTGETISDEEIEKILVSIYENENCNEPEYYIKALGDKKLSKVLRKRYGIIVNHKKIYKMRKELGLLRKYKKTHKTCKEKNKEP
ncbi:MAG TPA: transposase [Fervidobacterium sp.]|nr:transposase [Fervidobacterium sp.]